MKYINGYLFSMEKCKYQLLQEMIADKSKGVSSNKMYVIQRLERMTKEAVAQTSSFPVAKIGNILRQRMNQRLEYYFHNDDCYAVYAPW
jgi:hypothetical protein